MLGAGILGAGRVFALIAAMLVGGLCFSIGPAASQGVVRGTFGDWQLRCEPGSNGRDQCALVQNVAAESRPSIGLVIIIVKTPGAYLLRVMAPLNVLLPKGLGLRIDKVDIGRAGFLRCTAAGCFSEVTLDEGLLRQFKAGSSATFIIFMGAEDGIGFPISLAGLESGIAALP